MGNKKTTTSEWIVVRDSRIHGKGVFAAKDITRGTVVIEYVGKKGTKKESDDVADRDTDANKENEKNGAVYLFELNKKQDLDGNVSWNTALLINHSCDPNCETEGDDKHVWIVALRDIKKGEEINYNYTYDIDEFEEHPCHCGSKRCVGFILDEKLWPRLRKKVAWKKNLGKRKTGRS